METLSIRSVDLNKFMMEHIGAHPPRGLRFVDGFGYILLPKGSRNLRVITKEEAQKYRWVSDKFIESVLLSRLEYKYAIAERKKEIRNELKNLVERVKKYPNVDQKSITRSQHMKRFFMQIDDGETFLRPIFESSRKYIDMTQQVIALAEAMGFYVIDRGNDSPRGGKCGEYILIQDKAQVGLKRIEQD